MKHPMLCYRLGPNDRGYPQGALFRAEDRGGFLNLETGTIDAEPSSFFFKSEVSMFQWMNLHSYVQVDLDEMEAIRSGDTNEEQFG